MPRTMQCDQCGEIAARIPYGWKEVSAIGPMFAEEEPRETTFCSWNCVAHYADEASAVKSGDK